MKTDDHSVSPEGMDEEWKPVHGFEGLYEISSHGRLRGPKGICARKPEPNGYVRAEMWRNGERTRPAMHALVAEHFIPNPANKPIVNHIDGNRSNNKISNLEWVTHQENAIHGVKLNAKYGENNSNKLSQDEATAIKVLIKKGFDGQWIADVFGISKSMVSYIRLGKQWHKEAPRTKEEAITAKSKFYTPEEPCEQGHTSPRLTESGECTACLAEEESRKAREERLEAEAREAEMRDCPMCDKRFHMNEGIEWNGTEHTFCSMDCKRRADALQGVKMQWDPKALIEGEEWRPIKNLEDCYEASNMGRIRSIDRHMPFSDGRLRFYKGKIMKPRFGSGGYALVSLYGREGIRHERVHVLILETFRGDRPSRQHDGCHNDGNPANNRLDNLRWDTIDENLKDVSRHGRAWWQQRAKRLAEMNQQKKKEE